MCGIVGIVSNIQNSYETLMFGLRRLQNRGYDSAGICTIADNNCFSISKYASHNESAIELLEGNKQDHFNSSVGIAHTRWATHGGKSDLNSHPHVSYDSKWSLVHNGIVENYQEIKGMLLKNNVSFTSETDSEVIVNLLAYNYSMINDIAESIKRTVCELHGTWGLVILCIDSPNELYCTRCGSPLLIGLAEDRYAMVVSEQSGFTSSITDYIVLKNKDLCKITRGDNESGAINIQTNHNYVLQQVKLVDFNDTPDPYKHWTLKEIYQQPSSIQRAIGNGGRIESSCSVKLGGLELHADELLKLDNLILLGCGTSLNSCMLAKHYFKDLCNFNSIQVIDGADFDLADVPKGGKTGLVLVSQSGETKDLHRCVLIAKKNNLFTIGVVNVVDSLIAREVDCGCYLNAGTEVAVASTKSFTSQCIVLSMIAIWFSQTRHINCEKREQYISDLNILHQQINILLGEVDANIAQIIPFFEDQSSCFVLGKGRSESIAREGALKIKEISYIHCEGYSTSSLKHGPFALLCDKFPVILIAPQNEHYVKNENAYNEIKSRNATVIWITDNISMLYDNVLLVPKNKTYCDVLCVIPLQILAYKLSVNKGINPDMPKNLAKVVTVE